MSVLVLRSRDELYRSCILSMYAHFENFSGIRMEQWGGATLVMIDNRHPWFPKKQSADGHRKRRICDH